MNFSGRFSYKVNTLVGNPYIQQTLGEPRRISSISKASSKRAYIRTIRYAFPGVVSDRTHHNKSQIKTATAKLGESPAII